jgi:hypothetical protein
VKDRWGVSVWCSCACIHAHVALVLVLILRMQNGYSGWTNDDTGALRSTNTTTTTSSFERVLLVEENRIADSICKKKSCKMITNYDQP